LFRSSKLTDTKFNSNDDQGNPKSEVDSNGNIYKGERKNGIKHGYGKMFFKSGDTYEGDWKDGEMTGRGVYRWANGTVYEGGILEAKKHGLGWMKWTSGNSYYGEWSNDKRTRIRRLPLERRICS